MRKPSRLIGLASFGLFMAASCAAYAQNIKVGVTIPLTGPAASIGIGARNSISMFPNKIAGVGIEYEVLDDAGDPTHAVKNTKRFLGENVDLIVGSSTSSAALAMIEAIAGSETPMIALGASSRIVAPMDDKRHWVFKTASNDSLVATAIIKHMQDHGVKTVGFIGFSDAFGESWLTEVKAAADAKKIKLIDVERFNSGDTSATAQVLRMIAAKPDAVLIAAAGTPAVMPHVALKERGYKGKIYQTHGAATEDFLRVGGKALNGSYLPVGPNLVWEQLPDSYPTKAVSAKYVPEYEKRFGKNSRTTFAAQAYDVLLFLQRTVPEASKKAKPGTKEFREALRNALENIKNLPANSGVYNMTPTDHSGQNDYARVMVSIQNDKWKLEPLE
ncbi:MAG TPA: ABC transporter substrate-binding protein [Eoetvoesiella sp.]|uniref:ABC transporter substrate-binding protein n=1 Tax=Eoetvoesiella sp. TaxID=1966355 RepID=UPI002CA396F0|nr:ABC transporter substrate-binding protein [Eoetvoesiella sp.]HWK61374.1 ABC transporter substrate-binding protein [Eoetvoesiella sp.]